MCFKEINTYKTEKVSLSFFKLITVFIPLVVFASESVLNFVTGFYKNGILIMDFKKIIVHHMKRGMWNDILTFFIFIGVNFNYLHRYYMVFLLLRVLRVFKYYNSIN